MVNSTRKK